MAPKIMKKNTIKVGRFTNVDSVFITQGCTWNFSPEKIYLLRKLS